MATKLNRKQKVDTRKEKVKTVLVVEDEQTIANVLSQVLTFGGYRTVQAQDGAEALQQVEIHAPDAIVLDIVIPRMDGWEVCRCLKSNPKTRHIPIVIYTTLAQKKDIERGKELGANRYINKEKDPLEVLEAVKSLVQTNA